MGSGASAIPDSFTNLSEDDKARWVVKYEALVADGKSADEAIATLMEDQLAVSIETPTTEVTEEVKKPQIEEILLTQLVETIEAVIESGKTPFILDTSEDNKVDTFFSYRSAIIIGKYII